MDLAKDVVEILDHSGFRIAKPLIWCNFVLFIDMVYFCAIYRYGVILKKLDLAKDAVEILLESIHKEPLHWGTWQELVPLVTDREMVRH